jgi:hypothetical protein
MHCAGDGKHGNRRSNALEDSTHWDSLYVMW